MKTTWGTWTSTRQVRVPPSPPLLGKWKRRPCGQWGLLITTQEWRGSPNSPTASNSPPWPAYSLPTLPDFHVSQEALITPSHGGGIPWGPRGVRNSHPHPEVRKSIPLSVRGWVGNLDIYSHLAAPTFLCVRGSQLKQSLNKIRHFINITPQCARFNRKYLAILKNRKITTEWEKKKKMSTSRWQRRLFDKDFFIFFNI